MSDNENENDPEEYLQHNSQEDDMPSNNANPDNNLECEVDSKKHYIDINNGNIFPYKTELYDAVVKMKKIIYNDLFQSGPPEKVHDTEILQIYLDLIGDVWKSISHNMPLNLEAYSANIRNAVQQFLITLNSHLRDTGNTQQSNELRTRFLKLHLHCFPYCQNHECLNYD